MTGTWTSFSVPDSSTGQFTADVMILLTDGSVLVHNGYTSALASANQWLRLTPDHHGRYETGSWSSQLDMKYARQWFASGVLRDGRVFCMGGEDSTAGSDTPTGEIFDPLTNQWSDISKPSAFDFVRGDCNGSVLADGRVLLGGATPSGPPSSWSKRTAIWDPHHNSWVEAGLKFGALSSTDKSDPFEEETFVLLGDGSVLAPAVRDTPKAQRYVPLLDEWVHVHDAPVPLAVDTLNGAGVFETGPAILLPSGKVFVIGGTGKTAVFTPGPHLNSPGSWTAGPVFPPDTSASPNWPTLTALDAPACLLPQGNVVCLAGTTLPDGGDYFSFNPIFLEYDPHNPSATLPKLDVQPTLPAGNWTWQSCFLLLPTGQLLCSAQTNHLFLYTPDPASGAPHHDWRPAHIVVPECMAPGGSYRVSGIRINGLSQAVCYGDDGGMATNYPIVRLTNGLSGQVVYVRSHDFSTMSIAHTAPHEHDEDRHSCRIDIPSSLPLGDWHLVVIANGIASDTVPIRIATHCEEVRFVGKVEALAYDRFGDFDSFSLKTASGEIHHFDSAETRIGELARRAWQERAQIAVKVDPGHPHRPAGISFVV